MGQEEVLNFLRKHPKEWHSSKQIAEMMNTDPHILHVNLKRLRRCNHVHSKAKKPTKDDMSRYIYKFNEN